jgi:hypothetical protein
LRGITTGTGTGETIYAPRLFVQTTERQMLVTSRAKREARQATPTVQPTKTPQKQGSKYAYAFTAVERIEVSTHDDEVFILEKEATSTVSTSDDAVNILRRRI